MQEKMKTRIRNMFLVKNELIVLSILNCYLLIFTLAAPDPEKEIQMDGYNLGIPNLQLQGKNINELSQWVTTQVW